MLYPLSYGGGPVEVYLARETTRCGPRLWTTVIERRDSVEGRAEHIAPYRNSAITFAKYAESLS